VQAKLLDEEGWSHEGRIDFVGNEISTGSGTLKARALFDNSADVLLPGLFARLRVAASDEHDALLIPDAAVLSDQSRKIVMTADDEGVVGVKVVTLGQLHRGLRVIRSGLEPDDRVIVNGLLRARPGGKVVVEEVEVTLTEADRGAAN
jgi:RND family efflux transporter MFP subunit